MEQSEHLANLCCPRVYRSNAAGRKAEAKQGRRSMVQLCSEFEILSENAQKTESHP